MSEVDCSLKQLDLFGDCTPEEAGFGLRWQRMSKDCSVQTMVTHLQGASESYGNAGLVRSDGQFTTASISDWRKGGSACSLSAILEVNPATKYLLSRKACMGILRRSEKRGKVLPPVLDRALRQVAMGDTSEVVERSEAREET